MNKIIEKILSPPLSINTLEELLQLEGTEKELLFNTAAEIKKQHVGNVVYFRGLIELTNICRKNCYYCGIRFGNNTVERYALSDEEILQAARYAYENGFGSIVLQGGEITNDTFVSRIEDLIHRIKTLSNGELGITLSLGEQSDETYKRWKEAGAHRYLLRIETSNPQLYQKIHPNNNLHSFEKRLACLYSLKEIGYQVGTGVMIGLPFQTITDLANDLLFMYRFDIDMCGMGPYIEHQHTPLYDYRQMLRPKSDRLDLTFKMIALLRILMPDINIAAATALQAIDPMGREKAVKVGANIIMPNITPARYRNQYLLYENKPCIDENADDCLSCLEARISMINHTIGYRQWGDSIHYKKKSS